MSNEFLYTLTNSPLDLIYILMGIIFFFLLLGIIITCIPAENEPDYKDLLEYIYELKNKSKLKYWILIFYLLPFAFSFGLLIGGLLFIRVFMYEIISIIVVIIYITIGLILLDSLEGE